jgi:membrane fusion protein, multidrug efflux system
MADEPTTQSASPMSEQPPAKKANPRVRVGLTILGAFVLVIGAIALLRWWLHGRFIESTDDAYLRADSVAVAPRVSGYIDELYVVSNQTVKVGQPLLRIDERNYRAQLSQQQATLTAHTADISTADSQILQQQASIEQYRAQLAGAQANTRFARQEAERFKGLHEQGVETQERYEQALNQLDQNETAEHSASASLLIAQRQQVTLENQKNQAQAQLQAAQASLDAAKLNLDDTLLRASIEGRVGDDTAQLGEYVQPGTRLMSIVPVQAIYLVANFKETQLRRMHIGQPAKIRVDALDRVIAGRIESFAPGTGSQFALLPPENATGNFIKIVQRVPVRFRLLPPAEVADRLVPGLSVTVQIDTRESGH